MMDANNCVILLNGLEDAGLIERTRDPEDRRRHIVEITPKGQRALEKAERELETLEDDVLGNLDAAERDQLRDLLAKALEDHSLAISGVAGASAASAHHIPAGVAQLVEAARLKMRGPLRGRVGSNPTPGTTRRPAIGSRRSSTERTLSVERLLLVAALVQLEHACRRGGGPSRRGRGGARRRPRGCPRSSPPARSPSRAARSRPCPGRRAGAGSRRCTRRRSGPPPEADHGEVGGRHPGSRRPPTSPECNCQDSSAGPSASLGGASRPD